MADVLDQLYQDYPALKQYNFKLQDSTGKPNDWMGNPVAGRMLEFYHPDEQWNPNKGSPTIEQFSDKATSKDILGEAFSHYLPSVDPKFKDAKSQFVQGIDQNQKRMLLGDYQEQMVNGVLPKETTFDQWLSEQGGDAFFRGYIADQYPKDSYRPDQVKMFDDLMTGLKKNDN